MDRVRFARRGRDFLRLIPGPRRAAGPAPFVSAQSYLSRFSVLDAGLAVLAANDGQALRSGVADTATAATSDAVVTVTQASAQRAYGQGGMVGRSLAFVTNLLPSSKSDLEALGCSLSNRVRPSCPHFRESVFFWRKRSVMPAAHGQDFTGSERSVA